MSERSTTANKLKTARATKEKTIAHWPTTMVDRLDAPIGLVPVCPTSSSHPKTKAVAS